MQNTENNCLTQNSGLRPRDCQQCILRGLYLVKRAETFASVGGSSALSPLWPRCPRILAFQVPDCENVGFVWQPLFGGQP
jgi:hypothetical protein